MLKRAAARHILCILALGLTWNLPLAAQKLHNEARDKLAQQIKSDFEQLTSPEGNIFEQAIKNAEAINDADIQQWRDRERTLIESVATVLPFMSWKQLQDLAFNARDQILDVSTVPSQTDLDPKLQIPLSGISDQLKKIQQEEEGIKDELQPFEEADKNPIATLKQIEDAVKKTLDDGRPLKFDPEQLSKIKALPEDFSNLKKLVESLQPQGLNKLILQTKLLMLQNEDARLQLRQTHFKERQSKLQDFESHIQAYAGIQKSSLPPIKSCGDLNRASAGQGRSLAEELGAFWQVLGEICKDEYAPTHAVAATLQELAGNAKGTTSADPADPGRRLIRALNKLDLFLDLLAIRYDLLIEQTNLSQDELIFHIRMMRLNAQDQEVLLHSGITGLAIYEAGGIKPQDVANIIHTAQTLATAAIAARVK